MSQKIPEKPQLRPHVIKPKPGEKEAFSMTRFSPVTDDFYFSDDALVILSPFDVVWESPVLARSLKSLEEHIQFIQDNQIEKAIIVAEDISFLRRCPSLKSLRIIPAYSATAFDYSPLYDMPNLQELNCKTIHGPKDHLKTDLDYSRLSSLRQVHVNGAKGHHNLAAMRGLRRLYLGQGQPVSKTLTEFDLSELEELSLCESTLRSLEGLEKASHLLKVDLSCCRTLNDISALAAVGGSLISLEIDTCGRIKDFSCLKELVKLEKLVLLGSNSLPNLEFLEGMKNLKEFRFQMNVEDGDLRLCRNIRYVYCKNRKHYNLKNEDLPKGKQ